jgi:hypothetical protein
MSFWVTLHMFTPYTLLPIPKVRFDSFISFASFFKQKFNLGSDVIMVNTIKTFVKYHKIPP